MIKILICGNVDGQFERLFERVNKINAKSNFDLLLCAGDFFGVYNDFRDFDTTSVNIDTWVFTPVEALIPPNSPRIRLINKSQVIELPNGLVLAYKEDKIECPHGDVDILVTPEWPLGIIKNLPRTSELENKSIFPEEGTSGAAKAALMFKPRYHFSASKCFFYERPPFKISNSNGREMLSRFISIANVGNTEEKWLYAFSIKPSSLCAPRELLPNVKFTQNPYVGLQSDRRIGKKSMVKSRRDPQLISEPPSAPVKRKSQSNHEEFAKRIEEECWFCLGSTHVERHLIIEVSNHCYLALAKGGIDPYHVLILPIDHVHSFVCLDSDTESEMNRYKHVLGQFYAQYERVPFIFERNFRSPHLQVQVVGIPIDLAESMVETLYSYARSFGIKVSKLSEKDDLLEIAGPNQPYFYLEIGGVGRYYMSLNNAKNFPVNFGREILCDVFRCGERVDWRACILDEADERADVEEFRKIFGPFSFSE